MDKVNMILLERSEPIIIPQFLAKSFISNCYSRIWSWIEDLDLIFNISGIYVSFGWYIGTRLKSYNLGQKCLE